MTNSLNKEWTLAIGGMSCASCANRVEKALAKVPGVLSAEVNLVMETAKISVTPEVVTPDQLVDAVVATGFQAKVIHQESPVVAEFNQTQQASMPDWAPVAISALLSSPLLVAMLLAWAGWQASCQHGYSGR